MALDDLRERLVADFGGKSLLGSKSLLGNKSLCGRLLAIISPTTHNRSEKAKQGLYLWGAPGSGKTMLMELFLRSFESSLSLAQLPRRRIHFLAFMEEMHRAIADFNRSKTRNPIARLARQVARRSRLLCFDEFIVEDIVDAMLLGRLFAALLRRGVVLVATSNFALDELYKDGLKRDNFLPFLAVLSARVQSLEVRTACDYRSLNLQKASKKEPPTEPLKKLAKGLPAVSGASLENRDKLFSDLWFSQAQGDARIRAMFALSIRGGSLKERKIVLCEGRELELEQYGKVSKKLQHENPQSRSARSRSARYGVGLSSFAKVCELPRGVRDYRALLSCCELLFLTEIPELGETQRNETKRFMRLIDLFYEERALVLCATSAATPRLLYSGLSHAREFQRTASRLEEMITRAQCLL